jgi:tetratricopeptide (TPR) repeat protein
MDTPRIQTSSEVTMAQSLLAFDKEDHFLSHLPLDSERVLGQAYYRMAKLFYDKSDFEKAEEFFHRSLEKTQLPQDMFAVFKIYGFLVRIYSESQNELAVYETIKKLEHVHQKMVTELPHLTSEYFYNTGALASYKGELHEAAIQYSQAYKKAQLENEPEMMAKALHAMANTDLMLGKFQEAKLMVEQLNELLNILQKGYLKGSMHYLWGNVLRELGEFSEALKHFDLAQQLLHAKHCWNMHNYLLLSLGTTHKRMGDFSKSLVYFNMALTSVNGSSFQRLKTLIENEITDVHGSHVDLYLDRHNRVIHERTIGTIDFKHRFVLLEILFLLAQAPGKYYDKEVLAKMIWKDEYNPLIHDKLIYTSISRLRKLIEPTADSRQYILRGKDGYTFNPRSQVRFHRDHEYGKDKKIGTIEITSPV